MSGNVCADGVHQKVIRRVFFNSYFMHDSRRHRECRNTCRADHGVDFVFREQVHYLGAHNAAYGVEYEREQAERHNRKRFDLQEFFRLHLERYRNTEQQGYKIAQRVFRRVGKARKHSALVKQVAEHQKSDEREAFRGDKSRDHGYNYRKENFNDFADLFPLVFQGVMVYNKQLERTFQLF